ncbi:MAG TPA: helix-turn-helix transcriptional regulator [Myxococcales bacterium]|nr:helix-turn-helix transcriptional regulator [Myxococcales bacterium]
MVYTDPLTSVILMLVSASEQRGKRAVSFGETLRQLRKQAGLTQEQLSEASGVHQSKISRAELDKADLTRKEMLRLSGALSASPQLLMPKTPPPPLRPQPENHRPAKVATTAAIHPVVEASLNEYIQRNRHLLSDVQVERLPLLARGVNPADRHVKLDDRLWQGLADLIRSLYVDEDAN